MTLSEGSAGTGGRRQVVSVGPMFKDNGAAGGLWLLNKKVLRHSLRLRGRATSTTAPFPRGHWTEAFQVLQPAKEAGRPQAGTPLTIHGGIAIGLPFPNCVFPIACCLLWSCVCAAARCLSDNHSSWTSETTDVWKLRLIASILWLLYPPPLGQNPCSITLVSSAI